MMAAYPLVKWQMNHLIQAAWDTMSNEYQGQQLWMDMVWALYEERTTKARDLGSVIHGCIEKSMKGQMYDLDYAVHVDGAVQALNEWCGLDNIISEKSFAHPIGYGGTCDAHKDGFVADFKTKDFIAAELPKAWDNHAAQLAAYREGLGMSSARCAIIYVSTSVPGLTHTIEIDQDELDRAWDMFEMLVKLWQIKNRYKPVTALTKEEIFTDA